MPIIMVMTQLFELLGFNRHEGLTAGYRGILQLFNNSFQLKYRRTSRIVVQVGYRLIKLASKDRSFKGCQDGSPD
jgi:hypothetical protein